MAKLKIVAEYFSFLKKNKKWWIIPIAAVLIMLGVIIALSKGSVLAPFIYSLF